MIFRFVAAVMLCCACFAAFAGDCLWGSAENVVTFCSAENPIGVKYRVEPNSVGDTPMEKCACLVYFRSPNWFAMKIDNDGDLALIMEHSEKADIDFACWGPFIGRSKTEMLDSVCANDLLNIASPKEYPGSKTQVFEDAFYDTIAYGRNQNAAWNINSKKFRENKRYPYGTLADCSYYPGDEQTNSYFEYCYLPNVKKDEWYIFVISNFSKEAGTISFNKYFGSAETNCDIVVDAFSNSPVCLGDDIRLGVFNAPENAEFFWTGPNGFSSAEREPVISNAAKENAGKYSLVVKCNGVYSNQVQVDVEVNAGDVMYDTLFIEPNDVLRYSGEVYAKAGEYLVKSVSENGCESKTFLTIVPSVPEIEKSGLCEGESLNISLKNIPDNAGVVWKKDGVFAGAEKELKLGNCEMSYSGMYSAEVVIDGYEYKVDADVEVGKFYYFNEERFFEGEAYLWQDVKISKPGVYKKAYQTVSGCDSIYELKVVAEQVDLPIPSKVLSPNGDNINDRWTILNIELYPDASVLIVDRFGKEIVRYDNGYDNAIGWDGTCAGVDMPSSDYWYIVQDKSSGLTLTGHFSLIRQ